jgi:hypothetical protein
MTDSSFYTQRVSSGDYDQLVERVRNLGKRALINLEYKNDFERDARNSGFKLKSNGDKVIPFTAWVFGEIAPRAVGTLHQATGNHYFGPNPVRRINGMVVLI